MKHLALAATLAATAFAAPAFADGHTTQFAIMHFNMDADNASQLIMDPQGDPVMANLQMGTTLSDVFSALNLSADNMSEIAGQNGTVTILMSDPTYAAEIFRRLAAESDGDNN